MIFGFVKIIKGYAEIIDEGIALHLTKYTAIIIEKNKIFGLKDKVKPLKDYHFINVSLRADIGNSYSAILPLISAFLINYTNNYLRWFLYYFKPQMTTENQINIHEDKDVLEIYIKLTVLFNLLMVLISLIKIVVEKMICKVKMTIE